MEIGVHDIPEEFTAAEFTLLKSKEKLKFDSCKLFALMEKVEMLITDFCVEQDIYDSEAFQNILYTLCADPLPKVGCDDHYLQLMTNLIYDYLIIRFRFIGVQKQ